MTHLQAVRARISQLEQHYSTLHYEKDRLQEAWSEKANAIVPSIQKEMDDVLTALREAEAEERRLR